MAILAFSVANMMFPRCARLFSLGAKSPTSSTSGSSREDVIATLDYIIGSSGGRQVEVTEVEEVEVAEGNDAETVDGDGSDGSDGSGGSDGSDGRSIT